MSHVNRLSRFKCSVGPLLTDWAMFVSRLSHSCQLPYNSCQQTDNHEVSACHFWVSAVDSPLGSADKGIILQQMSPFLFEFQIFLLYPIGLKILIFIFTSTILHLDEDFSNLCRTPWITNFNSTNWLPMKAAYVPPTGEIKPHVVHPHELQKVQPSTKIKSVTMNPTGWIIWISSLLSLWRAMVFNLSWSSSPTWDSYFFTHFHEFILFL